jgi:uncharacterized protein
MKTSWRVDFYLITLTFGLLGLSFLPEAAHAQTALRPLPPVLSAVRDETATLSPSDGRALAIKLSEIKKRTKAEIIILLMTTVYPENIEAYVQRVTDHWKSSSQKLASGRYVFVVIAKDDHAIGVVPGEELTWVLKPFIASGIMNDTTLLFRQGNYFEALAAIAAKLSELIEANSTVAH